MRQWVDLSVLTLRSINPAQTRQSVLPVYVHCTRSANALSARATKCKRRIDFILYLDECIENHGSCLVEVDGIRLQGRFLGGLIGIPTIDFKFFEQNRLGDSL